MKIAVVGGGPAGLYFSLLMKKARAEHDVVVIERNPADATYGWGVVFSDRTLSAFREADLKTYEQITDSFIIWDAIDVRYRDQVVRCGGQVFSGIARKMLLALLQERCTELGVRIDFEREVVDPGELQGYDLIVAADGVRSTTRDAHHDAFRPTTQIGRSRYIWFGTERVFDSFTFAFRSNDDGFFQAHAYPFDGRMSTFIVECDEEAWRSAGLDSADGSASIAYCEELFGTDLNGHQLRSNDSRWLRFVTLKNKVWHHDNVVLVGDAAHTAHFSIGSGTKMAMEDSIALVRALEKHDDLPAALGDYESERKPRVHRLQEAARQSRVFFESTRHYTHMDPLQFAFHLLARSGRVDYDDLRVRDNGFVGSVDRWFSAPQRGPRTAFASPPAFAPLRLRGIEMPNRVVVEARPTYRSVDGSPSPGVLHDLTTSGAGTIATGTVAISTAGRMTPGCPGLYSEQHQEEWAEEVKRVRSVTEAAVAITLGHSGPRGSALPRTRVADVALADGGWPVFAASEQLYSSRSAPATELDGSGMQEVLEQFRSAARRAVEVGFDLVELHAGHGDLLASFLSPLTNDRDDEYGGSPGARLRYPLEVVEAVRAVLPDRVVLGIALTATDRERGGTGLSEAVAIARVFRDNGCDLVRVLAGQTTARTSPSYDPYHLAHCSDRIRNEARVTTLATGDITSVDRVNTLVAAGQADLCLLRHLVG